jgi:hypothetical protein
MVDYEVAEMSFKRIAWPRQGVIEDRNTLPGSKLGLSINGS